MKRSFVSIVMCVMLLVTTLGAIVAVPTTAIALSNGVDFLNEGHLFGSAGYWLNSDGSLGISGGTGDSLTLEHNDGGAYLADYPYWEFVIDADVPFDVSVYNGHLTLWFSAASGDFWCDFTDEPFSYGNPLPAGSYAVKIDVRTAYTWDGSALPDNAAVTSIVIDLYGDGDVTVRKCTVTDDSTPVTTTTACPTTTGANGSIECDTEPPVTTTAYGNGTTTKQDSPTTTAAWFDNGVSGESLLPDSVASFDCYAAGSEGTEELTVSSFGSGYEFSSYSGWPYAIYASVDGYSHPWITADLSGDQYLNFDFEVTSGATNIIVYFCGQNPRDQATPGSFVCLNGIVDPSYVNALGDAVEDLPVGRYYGSVHVSALGCREDLIADNTFIISGIKVFAVGGTTIVHDLSVGNQRFSGVYSDGSQTTWAGDNGVIETTAANQNFVTTMACMAPETVTVSVGEVLLSQTATDVYVPIAATDFVYVSEATITVSYDPTKLQLKTDEDFRMADRFSYATEKWFNFDTEGQVVFHFSGLDEYYQDYEFDLFVLPFTVKVRERSEITVSVTDLKSWCYNNYDGHICQSTVVTENGGVRNGTSLLPENYWDFTTVAQGGGGIDVWNTDYDYQSVKYAFVSSVGAPSAYCQYASIGKAWVVGDLDEDWLSYDIWVANGGARVYAYLSGQDPMGDAAAGSFVCINGLIDPSSVDPQTGDVVKDLGEGRYKGAVKLSDLNINAALISTSGTVSFSGIKVVANCASVYIDDLTVGEERFETDDSTTTTTTTVAPVTTSAKITTTTAATTTTTTTTTTAITTTTTEPAVYKKGDVNNSGVADITDALMVFRYLNEQETLDISAWTAADINGDGVVSGVDLLRLYRFANKRIPSL